MKKILVRHLALAWCSAFALSACGDDSGVSTFTDSDTDASTDAGDDDDDDDDDDDSVSMTDPETMTDPTVDTTDTDPTVDTTDTDPTVDTTDTDPTGDPGCGNSVQEPGEDCDGRDLGDDDCVTQGFDGGALQCQADCTFDTSECTNDEPMCGDNNVDRGEECDGTDLDGQDCTDFDFDGGRLACGRTCEFDTTNCMDDKPMCGDDTIDPGEECDGVDLGGQDCTDFDFTGGVLACARGCVLDTSGCESEGGVCTEPTDTWVNPGDCSCNGCIDDGVCNGDPLDDCICPDCDTDGFCATACTLDGVCDVFNEGCACADCSEVAECLDNPSCGDGMINGTEECEGMDLNGQDCAGLGFDDGVLACGADCGFDTSGCMGGGGMCIEDGGACDDPALCSCVGCDDDGICELSDDCTCNECDTDGFCATACTLDGACDPYNEGCACADCAVTSACDDTAAVCGDDVIGVGEDCEGADLGGADCTDLGFDGGVLACGADCSFDTSGCTDAGDVCIEDGGACTDPALCSCFGCDDDGTCELTDDCTCDECDTDGFCATACTLDGACDPYNEGCACADCAGTSACDDGGGDDTEVVVQGPALGLVVADGAYNGMQASMTCTTLAVAADGTDTVASVQLEVAAVHAWVGDFVIKVVSPTGTVVTVLNRAGSNVADDGTDMPYGSSSDLAIASPITFFDAAAVSAENMGPLSVPAVICAGDGVCDFAPAADTALAGTFASFTGQNSVGNWQVCFGDGVAFDQGSVDSVTLTIGQS